MASRDALRAPEDAAAHPGPARRPIVLYVAGAHRSGTTLLGRMLGQVEGLTFVGELDRLRFNIVEGRLCGCSEPLDRCAFWAEVGQRSLGDWAREDVRALLAATSGLKRRHVPALGLGPLARRARRTVDQHAALLGPVIHALHEATGEVIVDTSKTPMVLAALRRLSDVETRVVHIVRDPRGVAYSRGKKRLLEPGVFHWRISPHRASLNWSFDNLAFDVLGARAGASARLRYEDMVADPASELRRVLREVALPADDLDFVDGSRVTLGVSHSLSGNPMRFREGPLELRLDDEWRASLARRRQREVVALTWPLLRRYGYPVRSRAHEARASVTEPASRPPSP